ncbi:TPA: hypothetical protein ACJEU7_002574 [Acinetobacter baumannii]
MTFSANTLNALLPTTNGIENIEAVLSTINGFETEKANMKAFIEMFKNQSEVIKATLVGSYASDNVLYHIAKPFVSFEGNLAYKELSRTSWGVLCELLKPSLSPRINELLLDMTYFKVSGRELVDFELETIEKTLGHMTQFAQLAKNLNTAFGAENVVIDSSVIELSNPTNEQLFEAINLCFDVSNLIWNKTTHAINKSAEMTAQKLAEKKANIEALLKGTGTVEVHNLTITSFKNGKIKIKKENIKDNLEKMGFNF